MSFTGKSTFSAGSTLPEIVEDVSDIVSIISPYETHLLDHLGDPHRFATSTVHEWLEDELFPNHDTTAAAVTGAGTSLTVVNSDRFRPGDLIQVEGSKEVILVDVVALDTLTVTRGYGGTSTEDISDATKINILGNAAIEGDSKPNMRFTNRSRKTNYTQIFTAGVEVSGSQMATNNIGVKDELDYLKSERLRELVRDLENCVINGVAHSSTPTGSSTIRRTMRGIIPSVTTNQFVSGAGSFPSGAAGENLTEEQLNFALRKIWEQSSGNIDTIVVNGHQKRRINNFITASRGFDSNDMKYRDMVNLYESDFGVCKVLVSRWVPSDTVLLLDSSRIDVLPLQSRSFHFKNLASLGDSDVGQVIGEYTLEIHNENAHGVIRGLATS